MPSFTPTKPVGAIMLSATGQEWPHSCRITGIIWEGTATQGDRVRLTGRNGSATGVFWVAHADLVQNYMGAMWDSPGLHAPDGFKAERLDSGTLYVYVGE